MKKLNNGVSAIIGVILMTAITVAIAATVYVYVAGMIDSSPEGELIEITGIFNAISENGSIRINDTWYYFHNFDENYIVGLLGHEITITYTEEDDIKYVKCMEAFEWKHTNIQLHA